MAPIIKLPLPAGPLGIAFEKGAEGKPCVTRVMEGSAMKGKIKEGYVFEFLEIDGKKEEGLSVKELVTALKTSVDEEGRMIGLKMGLPTGGEIDLPTGDLGFKVDTINGKASIAYVAKDCPIADSLRVGMVVDKITLPDGTIVTGYPADEVNSFLTEDDSSGRKITVLNPSTGEFSEKSITLPMMKEIVLPTGKIGLSFKGTSTCAVTKISPTSPMQGKARVGMLVESIKMPNGVVFSGYGAVDLTTILLGTSSTAGRVLVLKSPLATDLPTMPTKKVILPRFGLADEVGITFSGTPPVVHAFKPRYKGKLTIGDVIVGVVEEGAKSVFKDSSEAISDAITDSSGSSGRYIILKGGPPVFEEEEVGEAIV